LNNILIKLDNENQLFSDKSALDNLAFPPKIIGRGEKTEELARKLYGYKKGYVVPFISTFGRSGCGKSTLVRFVCENLPDISYAFVNLRKSKTVFGCANLILAELGEPNVKSSQGIHSAIEKIGTIIETRLKTEKTKCFVLVLDEFDVLFEDKRGKPSDFVYKLVTMEEKLKEMGYLVCIITISNNLVSDYDLDDRVISRIGSTEVFFGAYTKDEVFQIMSHRAKKAFAKEVDSQVLQYCAEMSAEEHGDARRAIDLLRVAAELASNQNEDIAKNHVELASKELDKERIDEILSNSSLHLKTTCAALVHLTFFNVQNSFSTQNVYNMYKILIKSPKTPLSYRRVSGLLKELAVFGIIHDNRSSYGRYGQNTEFQLVYPVDIVGPILNPDWWDKLQKRKADHDKDQEKKSEENKTRKDNFKDLNVWKEQMEKLKEKKWKKSIGDLQS